MPPSISKFSIWYVGTREYSVVSAPRTLGSRGYSVISAPGTREYPVTAVW